jgi:zinc-binding alcohol dehydrogenase family protein
MPAVVSYQGLPVDDDRSLVEAELPVPELRPHDLLVRVAAVSVNPVDVKRRAGLPESTTPTVLGYDAAGVVAAVGPAVTGYRVGDEVYYAGDVTRPGSNAEYQAVDERIVGHKPRSLSWAEAAAMPLTTITAWESLFGRFRLTGSSEGTLLVLPGAGGVGSILIQLAKRLTGLTVIATASRSESRDFARNMGADHIVDHHGDLATEVLAIAPGGTDYIFSAHSASTVPAFVAVAKPFSEITAIDDATGVELQQLKPKSLTWHWELMFTRSTFGTPDLAEQGVLLERAAELFDDGTLRPTLTTTLEGFTADNLRQAHRLVESGRMTGKVVVVR